MKWVCLHCTIAVPHVHGLFKVITWVTKSTSYSRVFWLSLYVQTNSAKFQPKTHKDKIKKIRLKDFKKEEKED